MRQDLFTDVVSIIKQNGSHFDDVKASVQTDKIFISDTKIPIEEGDEILRELPNGLTEKYLVFHCHYWEAPKRMMNASSYYEIKVRKASIIEDEKSSQQFNIGTLIQGNMSGGNVVSVGIANDRVSQVVNDPELLTSEIDAIINRILEEVKNELSGNDLLGYAQTVTDIKQELLSQKRPKQSIFKQIIKSLSLLDNANGSIELIATIWPFIQALITIALALPK